MVLKPRKTFVTAEFCLVLNLAGEMKDGEPHNSQRTSSIQSLLGPSCVNEPGPVICFGTKTGRTLTPKKVPGD